jgi:hypothetical protein
MVERRAKLHLDGWAGRWAEDVIVVDETPKRYRIRVDKRVRLAGPHRYLSPGQTALVPKRAVTFVAVTEVP